MGQKCCRPDEDERLSASASRLSTLTELQTRNNSDEEQRQQRKVIVRKLDWVKSVIEKGRPFTDPDFKPEVRSIFDEKDTEVGELERSKFEGVVWKRCSEIFPNRVIFPVSAIDSLLYQDVQQGFLGNCYLMTVLSAMAEHEPKAVINLFETDRINRSGIYMICFYVNGIRTPVVIDDYIPVWPYNNEPVFAKAPCQAIWVLLLEKAWAKLHGTYMRTDSNSPHFAAHHLQGVPAYAISHSTDSDREQDRLYVDMIDADRRGSSIYASTLGAGQREIVSESGLISGQSYPVVSVFEIEDEDGMNVCLIKLRNPWKFNTGTAGEWASDSARWTASLRKLLGFRPDDDSYFFLTFYEYTLRFKRTSFALLQDLVRSSHSRVKHSFKIDAELQTSRPAFFKFFLERDIDLSQETLTISVHQQGDRLANYKLVSGRFVPATYSILLMTAEGDIVECQHGPKSFMPVLKLKNGILPASGDGYIIVVDSAWEVPVAHQDTAAQQTPQTPTWPSPVKKNTTKTRTKKTPTSATPKTPRTPTQDKNTEDEYQQICIDVYCPGQAIFMREESMRNGFAIMQEVVRKEVYSNGESCLERVDKYPEHYGNKVVYAEDAYFFADWFGFMYFRNLSERRFSMTKNMASCTGFKVVNHLVSPEVETIEVESGEEKIYLLKRTSRLCKFIPFGKVLPANID